MKKIKFHINDGIRSSLNFIVAVIILSILSVVTFGIFAPYLLFYIVTFFINNTKITINE